MSLRHKQQIQHGIIASVVLGILRFLGARDLRHPLQLLYGRSFKVFIGRLFRLRTMARSMRRGEDAPPLPIRLQIETTDICNFKCRMCTREVIDGMNTKTMPLEQFKSVVDEIAPYYLTMNGLGEPLLDKTIFDKLEFAHQSGIATAMPTNGTYIRGEKLGQLAENMPDILTFSIDGAQKSSFEYVRVLSNFDQVIANYRALLARRARGETRPNTRVHLLCALQKANLRDYKAMWLLKKSMAGIDAFNLVPVFDYDPVGKTFAGLVPSRQDVLDVSAELDVAIAETSDPEEAAFYNNWKSTCAVWLEEVTDQTPQSTGSCLVPWYSTYIDSKGRVYPCCYLTNSSHVMGNINEQSFTAIWQGDAYRNFRHALVHDRKNLAGCNTCSRNDDARLHQLQKLSAVL